MSLKLRSRFTNIITNMNSNVSFQIFSESTTTQFSPKTRRAATVKATLAIAGVLLIVSGGFFLNSEDSRGKNSHNQFSYMRAPTRLASTARDHSEAKFPQDALTVMLYFLEEDENRLFVPYSSSARGSARVRALDYDTLYHLKEGNYQNFPTQKLKYWHYESYNAYIKDEAVVKTISFIRGSTLLEACFTGEMLRGCDNEHEVCYPISTRKVNYTRTTLNFGQGLAVFVMNEGIRQGRCKPWAVLERIMS